MRLAWQYSHLKTILAFAFIALAFSACSDDETPDRNNNGDDMGVVDMTPEDDTGDVNDMGTPPDMNDPDVGDPDMGGDFNEVICPTATPAPSGASLCDATAGTSSQVLIQAGSILAPNKTIYRDGYVLVDESSNEIVCVGCDCDAQAVDASVVSCADGVVSPSLINTHEHITFSLSQPQPTDDRFDHRHDWRLGGDRITRNPGSDNSREALLYIELRNLFAGTTSIAGSVSSADGSGLLRNLDNASLLEAGVTGVDVTYRTFPLGDSDGTQATTGCDSYNIDSENRLSAGIYMPHIAEGINAEARNEFLCMSDETIGTDLIEGNTSIVHGVGLTAPDIAEIASNGAKLIWSPRSNISLYGITARIPLFRYYGITIALGTDWSPSGSAELLRELKCADDLNRDYFGGVLTDHELWQSVTENASVAMGSENQLGFLAAGFVADIAIFDGSQNSDYRAIIDARPADVSLVMRGATPLLGDSNILEAIIPADQQGLCERVDVCSRERIMCIERDTGLTMDAIRDAIDPNSYGPLTPNGVDAQNVWQFVNSFCDAPPEEPSCTPFRPNEFDGVVAGDVDGDGIDDGVDICVDHFNPIRPLDEGVQADFDNDGIGGECDVCPLTVGPMCEMFDPNDRDGDGVDNFDDNCPAIPNELQEDADNDMIGDVCDACPMFDNTVADYCPATIYEIRAGLYAKGTRVLVEDAVVTASGDNEFFMQVDPDDAGFTGVDNSGLEVYLGNGAVMTTPAPLAIIDLVGSIGDFGGAVQIENVSELDTNMGATRPTLPPFTSVTAAEVDTGGTREAALQGTLIQISDVTVTNPNPDLPDDFGEFEVDGLRVDDLLYEVVPRPALGDTFTSVSGVLHYGFENSKLIPRGPQDLATGPPALVGFDPPTAFLPVNSVSATPTPGFDLVLTSAPTTDLTIALAYAGDISGPATVVVTAGTSRAPVLLSSGATTAGGTVTATLDMVDVVGTIVVYDDLTTRNIADLTPATADVSINATVDLVVTLDVPAGTGGQVVDVSVAPGNAATVPATVTVPEGALSATITATAGALPGTEIVTASIAGSTADATINVVQPPANCLIISEYIEGSGSNNKAFELYNCSGTPLELSDFGVCLISNANTSCNATAALGTKTLAAGEVHTICKTTSGSAGDPIADIVNNCQEAISSVANFNGDDRLLVFRDADGSATFNAGDEISDALGETTVRPAATTWQDKTLRRCYFAPYDGLTAFSTSDYFETTNDTSDYGTAPVETCAP